MCGKADEIIRRNQEICFLRSSRRLVRLSLARWSFVASPRARLRVLDAKFDALGVTVGQRLHAISTPSGNLLGEGTLAFADNSDNTTCPKKTSMDLPRSVPHCRHLCILVWNEKHMPSSAPQAEAGLAAHLTQRGGQLRRGRKSLDVSATTTAKAAGLSRTTLHRIESSEPSVTLGAYANVAAAL